MSRPPASHPSASALRMRRLRERQASGVQSSAAPWRWLSKLQFQELAGQAYLVATREAARARLHPPGDADKLFLADLDRVLHALLYGAAVDAGNVDPQAICRPCSPDDLAHCRQAVQAVQAEGWRPQYPLWLASEDGCARERRGRDREAATSPPAPGGMGAAAPMATSGGVPDRPPQAGGLLGGQKGGGRGT